MPCTCVRGWDVEAPGAVSLEGSGGLSVELCLRDSSVKSVRSILTVGKALCWALREEEKRKGFLTRGAQRRSARTARHHAAAPAQARLQCLMLGPALLKRHCACRSHGPSFTCRRRSRGQSGV